MCGCVYVCVCVFVGVLIICVLVFTVYFTICDVFFVLFRLCILFCLHWCKDCCHRVTTQLQLVIVITIIIIIITYNTLRNLIILWIIISAMQLMAIQFFKNHSLLQDKDALEAYIILLHRSLTVYCSLLSK